MSVYVIVEDCKSPNIVGVTKDDAPVFGCPRKDFYMTELYILAHAREDDMVKPDKNTGIIPYQEYKAGVAYKFKRMAAQ